MDQDTRNEVAKRLQEHARLGTTDLVEKEWFQPVDTYTDEALAEKERRALKQMPMVAAHVSELERANDFVTFEYMGVRGIVVRQKDGSFKAFTNVCRHRGATLEEEERGNRRFLVCPFHNWSYDGTGRLRSMPGEEGFCNVDRSKRGLIELPVDVRHGLVWVGLTPDGEIDVAGHLGRELDSELEPWALDGVAFERAHTFEVDANWKLVIDGFTEDYHLTYLHKKTIAGMFIPNLHLYDTYGQHSRFIPARSVLKDQLDIPPEEFDVLRNTAITYVIFPFTVLIWQRDHFELWTITPHPTDVAKCTARVWILVASPEEAIEKKAKWDANWELVRIAVEAEDWPAVRGIQENIPNGGQSDLVFGRNEPALQHFHAQVEAAVQRI